MMYYKKIFLNLIGVKEAALLNNKQPDEKKRSVEELVSHLPLSSKLESAAYLYERATVERLENPSAHVTATFDDYQRAAEAGSLFAHYYLGRCYETGRGGRGRSFVCAALFSSGTRPSSES
jgi:TPR repeat protein